ncbi:hypothetical protein [Rodentibacter myodis]|uniref:hypothetical protein n=1 Tax=Rodentibacter myodis TaxID=1907939 RepID=UPI0009849E69
MVVEPALVWAMLQSDSRIFQHQNSEKILRTLLQKNRVENVTFEPLPMIDLLLMCFFSFILQIH